MIIEVSGIFTKIAFATDEHIFLQRGASDRPAGRFNRPGQDALYLSQNFESARSALTRYVKSDDPERVVIQYNIEPCKVFDLRHPDSIDLLMSSRGNWQEAMENQAIPTSWEVADQIRDAGYVGLIDPSRQNPAAWHLVLFTWNEPNTPIVKEVGSRVPVQMS